MRRLKALSYTDECRNICVSEHVNMTTHSLVEMFQHFGVTYYRYFNLKTEEVAYSETSVNLYHIVTHSITHTTVIFTVTTVQTKNLTCTKIIFIFMYISKRKLFSNIQGYWILVHGSSFFRWLKDRILESNCYVTLYENPLNCTKCYSERTRWENATIDTFILCRWLSGMRGGIPPCIPESHPHRITSIKCCINTVWGKKTNKMQQYRWFIVNYGWMFFPHALLTMHGHRNIKINTVVSPDDGPIVARNM